MDETNQTPPPLPAVRVDPLQLREVRAVVCEIYEAAADDLSVRTPVRHAIVALANAKADLREIRERLINGPPPADPVRLRGEMVAVAAYLARTVVQLGLPGPVRLPNPEEPAMIPPPPADFGPPPFHWGRPLLVVAVVSLWTLANVAAFWWAGDSGRRTALVAVTCSAADVVAFGMYVCSGRRQRDRGTR